MAGSVQHGDVSAAMVDYSELLTLLYAVGNVTSSVTLVLLNKRVFSNGFYYPMTLSFFHFVFTIGFYEALRLCDVYKRPEKQMPQFEKFKVAFAGFSSIGFMNLSLTYNSVGFYQAAAELLSHLTPSPTEALALILTPIPSPSPALTR